MYYSMNLIADTSNDSKIDKHIDKTMKNETKTNNYQGEQTR